MFYNDAKDQLTPALSFPSGLKKKAVYFRKQEDFMVNAETVKNLDCGDVAFTQVDQVSSMVDGIVVPTLDNTPSTTKWPRVVSSDVTGHGHVWFRAPCRSLLSSASTGDPGPVARHVRPDQGHDRAAAA